MSTTAALVLAVSGLATASPVRVAARYDVRVVHVETIGTLFNDQQEVGGASGLLIGDNLVLTNNHVIPLESNYRKLEIYVRPKSRHLAPVSVSAVHRDPQRDLALLELATVVHGASGPRCPMPVIRNAQTAPMGTQIYVLGFPLNQDLSITGGLISNQNGENGRWQTDSVMNPGNSGGPVFDDQGALIGIAVGGIVKWTYGGQTVNVDGVNFLIPAPLLRESPLYDEISKLPTERRCWTEERFLGIGETTSVEASDNEVIVGGAFLPSEINRVYIISETKDDHPKVFTAHSRSYERAFNAEPGYKIGSCSLAVESANHANDVRCDVNSGDTSATLKFRLESGPAIDRWRGWWAGAVTLKQARSP